MFLLDVIPYIELLSYGQVRSFNKDLPAFFLCQLPSIYLPMPSAVIAYNYVLLSSLFPHHTIIKE